MWASWAEFFAPRAGSWSDSAARAWSTPLSPKPASSAPPSASPSRAWCRSRRSSFSPSAPRGFTQSVPTFQSPAAAHVFSRGADRLDEEGLSAAVPELRTLVPLDVEMLCSEVAKTGRCVVVHEAPLSAGFGAEISATLMEQIFYDLDAPVARVAAYDVPFPPASLEDYYLPSLDRVLTAVRKTLQS